MAKGTRVKTFESQLQQTGVVINECQNKMEQLELGMTRNQEAILVLDRKVEDAMNGMERRLEGSITRVQDELGAQMQQFRP